jgi:DNA-binding IclR family transcriptional regulator
MARPSPPTDRVVLVLDLLANHPGEPMSFTDISRRLSLSRATCHALLASLTDAGYIMRNDDKTYLLGPSLIAVGRSAERSYPYVPAVREVVTELVERTNRSCVLTVTDGTTLTVLDYEGQPPRGEHTPHGNRVPFAAPFGVVLAAWSGESMLERWAERGAEMGAGRFERSAQLLQEVRERGYSASPMDPERRQLWELFELAQKDLVSDDLRRMISRARGAIGHDYLWEELAGRDHVAVSSVSSPVFAAPRRAAFAIHLEILDEHLPFAELERLAAEVVATAQRASALVAEARDGTARSRPH